MNQAARITDSRARAMEKRMTQLGRQLGNSLKVGFGLGTAALGLYIKNTIDAEKVQAQLAARIKDTGGAAGRTLQQLGAQADKLQQTTVFDDEAIGEAQAAMLTFKNVTGETFDRAIEASTDLATVMGTDVADAAKVLGKALADPTAGMGALKKAGIVLTEDQKAMIESFQQTGDVASAQRVILDALAGTMGTAAEAARDTLGGALQGLKNAFNNMLEGDSGSAGALGAKKAIQDLTTQMNSPDVKAGFDAIVGGIADVARFSAEAIGAVTGLSRAIIDSFNENNMASYDTLLNRFDSLEYRIKKIKDRGALTEGVFGLGTTLEELQAEKREIQSLLEQMRARSQRHPKSSGTAPAAPAAPDFLVMDPMTIHPHRGGGGGGRGHSAVDDEKRLLEQAKEAAKQFQDQLQDMRDEIAGPLAEALTEHNRKLAELKDLQEKGKLSAEDLKAAQDAETTLYDRKREAIEKTLNPLAEVVKQQERELELMGLTGAALEAESIRLGTTAEQWAKYGDAITQNAQELDAQQKAIEAADHLRDSMEDTFASIFDGSKSAKEAFKDLANSIIADIARVAAHRLVEGIFGPAGTTGTGSAGGGLLGMLGKLLIPGHAAGTNYSQGGLALVGERGPELVNLPRGSQVMPNHRMRGALGGDVYNITVPVSGEVSRKTKHDVAHVTARRLDMARRGTLK